MSDRGRTRGAWALCALIPVTGLAALAVMVPNRGHAKLGLVYIVTVVGMQALFARLTGGANTLAVVASPLAIAALFQPLRIRVQTAIDQRLYRRAYDAAKILGAFARRSQQDADLDAVSRDVVAPIQEALEPEAVMLWLIEGRR
jgi:hypothetical protein